MPKQVDHALRRRQLVEASWDVIAAEGIEGVTLRKVAQAADCTTGRIAHYFSGREELVRSALRAAHKDAARRMMRIARSSAEAQDRLRRVAFEGLPLDAARLREWKVWLVFWASAASNAVLAEENVRRYADWQGLLTSLLTEIGTDADTPAQAEPQALELASLIDGLGIRTTLSPTPANRRLARDAVNRWIANR
jgi:TetR/AcrR family transcriptional repressor of bet genes